VNRTMNHQPFSDHVHWYVVQSKPRDEERARHFLQEKGFRTYLPRMEIVKIVGLRPIRSENPYSPVTSFAALIPRKASPTCAGLGEY